MKYPEDYINKVICGDCLEVMKDIPDKSVDLVLTDPPYGIEYKTNHRIDKSDDFRFPIYGDKDLSFIKPLMIELYRVMKNDSAMYMFCSPSMIYILQPSIIRFFMLKNIIIWVKNNWTAGDLKSSFGRQYESLIYANKGR